MEGYGLKKWRIAGKGMEGVNEAKKSKETVMKKIINGKYIDLNKLKIILYIFVIVRLEH